MKRESFSQSPRHRILWILTNSEDRMDRSRLRRCVGMKLADLDPNLAELAREDWIEVSGEIV